SGRASKAWFSFSSTCERKSILCELSQVENTRRACAALSHRAAERLSPFLPYRRKSPLAFAQHFDHVPIRHLIEIVEELTHGGKVRGHIHTHHGITLVQHCPRRLRRRHGD